MRTYSSDNRFILGCEGAVTALLRVVRSRLGPSKLATPDRHSVLARRMPEWGRLRVCLKLNAGLGSNIFAGAVACFVVLLLLKPGGPIARAQSEDTGWASPVAIARSSGNLASGGMSLLSDTSGRLHLFYLEQPDESTLPAVLYMRLDETGWSHPVDVVVDPDGSMGFPRAVIDSDQVVHLFWLGSNYRLKHSSAPLADASNGRAWSQPGVIASSVGEHDVLATPDGKLLAVYSTAPAFGALSLIESTNGGKTWSSPVPIALSDKGALPGQASMAVDGLGRLHVAWMDNSLSGAGWSVGAFYTRSTDGGVTWRPRRLIAGPRHGEIGVAAVGNDEVHLVWRSNIGGDGTFHQVSTDGGVSWNVPDRYDDRGGFSGAPAFVIDSMSRLHYVIGHGYHAMWEAGGLSDYVDVATQQLRSTASKSDAELATLAITTGNRLHVVFENDFNSLWYTSKLLDSPLLLSETPKPASVFEQEPTGTAEPSLIPAESGTPIESGSVMATPIPPVSFSQGGSVAPTGPSQAASLLAGAIPVAVLVGAVVLFTLMRRKPR